MEIIKYIFIVAFVIGIPWFGYYQWKKTKKLNKGMDTSDSTFESLQADVREFVKEIDLAVALTNLSKAFHQDNRISEKFDNTYEAHPFELCRQSVDYSLALAICRCHDHRPDSHGLSAFFTNFKEDYVKLHLREGILARRRLHVGAEKAVSDTEDHLTQIERARKLQASLKGSHKYASVRNFRHTYIAHRGKNKATVKSTETTYLYSLVEQSQDIVHLLTGAVLGSNENFEGGSEIWSMYVKKFFNVLMK